MDNTTHLFLYADMLLIWSAGFSKWLHCWLCHSRSTSWFSRKLSEPEFSSWIFSFWYWKWFHVSGLFKYQPSFSLLLFLIFLYSLNFLFCHRTTWLMDHKGYSLRSALMTLHKMMHPKVILVWPIPTQFSLRFLLVPMLTDKMLVVKIIKMARCKKHLSTECCLPKPCNLLSR